MSAAVLVTLSKSVYDAKCDVPKVKKCAPAHIQSCRQFPEPPRETKDKMFRGIYSYSNRSGVCNGMFGVRQGPWRTARHKRAVPQVYDLDSYQSDGIRRPPVAPIGSCESSEKYADEPSASSSWVSRMLKWATWAVIMAAAVASWHALVAFCTALQGAGPGLQTAPFASITAAEPGMLDEVKKVLLYRIQRVRTTDSAAWRVAACSVCGAYQMHS